MSKVCINCGITVTNDNGEAVSKLYDEKLYKKSRILKLVQCSHCGRLCDKYLEYDGTLLLLDAALQSKPALRHFLINEDHSATIRKVSLLTLIVDGYCRWSGQPSEQRQFFEQEFEFYSRVGEATASLLVYLAVSSFLIVSSSSKVSSVVTLVHGLLLAYCTRFLLLVALLWITPTTTFLWTAVDIFFFLSSVSVSRVLTEQSHGHCLALMLAAHLGRVLSENLGVIITGSVICD